MLGQAARSRSVPAVLVMVLSVLALLGVGSANVVWAGPRHADTDACVPPAAVPVGRILGRQASIPAGGADAGTYRVRILDFGAILQVELPHGPVPAGVAPPRLRLLDWRGCPVAASADENSMAILRYVAPVPGEYGLQVESPSNGLQASPQQGAATHQIATSVTFAAGREPRILYSGAFRDDGRTDGAVGPAASTASTAPPPVDGRSYVTESGPPIPRAQPLARGRVWGPLLSDFVLTVDVQVPEGSAGGYQIVLRPSPEHRPEGAAASPLPEQYLAVLVDPHDRRVALQEVVKGVPRMVQDWVPWPDAATAPAGNPNPPVRTVVRRVGHELLVNLDGTEVLLVPAAVERADPLQFGFGAFTWADPFAATFSGVLVTTAITSAPEADGPVVLADSFDDPSQPVLGTSSDDPTRVTLAYDEGDGEFQVRKGDPTWEGVVGVSLPVALDDATVAFDARVLGEVDQQYLSIACRHSVDAQGQEREYRFVIVPATGQHKLSRIASDTVTDLQPWQVSPLIRTGHATNRLELRCVGSSIEARANGRTLTQVIDSELTTGRFWMGVSTFAGQAATAEARFDNLLVTGW